jgi:pimeloyl-ACP methyl ester carboxylesterase
MTRPRPIALMCALFVSAHCGVASTPNGQHRFFDSDGVRLRYQVSGQGPPVVLIHGFGETLERWETAGVTQALTPHFRVIVLDVRGHGQSGKPHEPESYGPALATDVVNLLHQVGAPKAHIVGYSLGALVALDIAAHHQESALSVVLGGAGWITQEALDGLSEQADTLEREGGPLRSREDARALAALLRGLQLLREDDVRRITAPMVVLVGANDRFFPYVRRLSNALPAVDVVVIPNASHATALDDPAFAKGLLAFLQKTRRMAQ